MTPGESGSLAEAAAPKDTVMPVGLTPGPAGEHGL